MKEISKQKVADFITNYWNNVIGDLAESVPRRSMETQSKVLEAKKGYEGRKLVTIHSKGIRMELWMPRYWQYLDEGVAGAGPAKPGKTMKKNTGKFRYGTLKPPIFRDEAKYPRESKILDWLKKAQIAPGNYKELRKLPFGSREREKPWEQLAWAISESIRVHGTQQTDFYSKVVNNNLLEDFEKKLIDLVGSEIMITIVNSP